MIINSCSDTPSFNGFIRFQEISKLDKYKNVQILKNFCIDTKDIVAINEKRVDATKFASELWFTTTGIIFQRFKESIEEKCKNISYLVLNNHLVYEVKMAKDKLAAAFKEASSTDGIVDL